MPDEPGERMGGSYPGGPRRRRPGEDRGQPDLEGVGEIEERVARAGARLSRGRRVRRVRIGFVLALLVSGGIGLTVGWLKDRTTEQMAQEREDARLRNRDVSQEVNRVLLELWKMEDLERAQGPGR